jgi:hypothetical protein
MSDMKIFLDHRPGSGQKMVDVFRKEGYDGMTGEFLGRMGFRLEEGKKIGGQHGMGDSRTIRKLGEKRSTDSVVPGSNTFSSFMVGWSDILDIDPLGNEIEYEEKIEEKGKIKIRKSRKEVVEDLTIIARKPLHLVPLGNTSGTVFSEMKEINPKIDIRRFEEYFCDTMKESTVTGSESKKTSVLNDSNRLFLASLSIKQLELKGISGDRIAETVERTPEILTTQDLFNIDRLFLTRTEEEILENADDDEISEVERIMGNVSRRKCLLKIVKILMFERRVVDEMIGVRQALDDMILGFSRIIESEVLKYVMKTDFLQYQKIIQI